MARVMNVSFASSLTDLCEVNSSFDSGVLRICYTGPNRNGSDITPEAIDRALPSIYNCPIVCNYDRETDSLGGHDIELVREDNGNMHIVNLTEPIGIIPESAKVWYEDYEEDDGTVHKYLYANVLLWKRQEAYAKIRRDGVTSHSMEITVKDGEMVDGIYRIKDFEFTAFALISVEPCFESSALELFSKQNFKEMMFEMMQEMKGVFNSAITSNEVSNIDQIDLTMEGGEDRLDEKFELLAKYGLTVEELDFALDDFTVEELAEKLEAVEAAKVSDEEAPVEKDPSEEESVEDEPADNTSEGDFALVSNMIDELRCAVACLGQLHREYGEIPQYWFVDADFEAGEVYCEDRSESDRLYGFNFTVNGDSIAIDVESKKRKKYSIVDFEGEDQPSPMTPVFELLESKLNNLVGIEQKFNEVSATVKEMETELNTLRQFKADADNAVALKERNEVFAKFEDLAGNEAFETLKTDCMKYDLETLEEKCFAIRGRAVQVQKFDFNNKPPKLHVTDKSGSGTNEPYGGLFVQYNVGQ